MTATKENIITIYNSAAVCFLSALPQNNPGFGDIALRKTNGGS